MSYQALIKSHFEESIAAKQKAMNALADVVSQSAEILVQTLKQDGKIFACGNGGSAADCQHFAAELMNRFETERAPLPAIALTTDTSNLTSIANDYSYAVVFSKQLTALANRKDCLVVISTSGNSPSVLNAIHVGLQKGLRVIALTGKNGGEIARIQHPDFLEIRVPHARTARIQEVHMLIIHAWCHAIDVAFID